ncbi:nitroreductase family protein [Thomasclavelia sp.]|uniref:nitroreductase family protein n=1 Tax=Thomasclavelia sp. TaxID=3025757 RepID=UPI0025EC8551|nr:nitroreductase family protein [Thomasclavelia sp.]
MNPDELLELIKTRRSYRTFEDKQINDQQLDMILEAGLYAPNAGGRQSILFLVTQDKQINEQLGKISRQVAHVVKGRYVSKEQPSIIDNPDIKSALYGAPTVITLLGPKDFIFSEADCCVACQNMMLMAHALGLGSCMISRAALTMNSDFGKALLEKKKSILKNIVLFIILLLVIQKGKLQSKKENHVFINIKKVYL